MDIGIIGLGGAGRAHAKRFKRNKNVRSIIGFDIRQDLGLDQKIDTVSNLDELLSNVDAVSICTPDHLHLRDIERCLREGKHVLVEKPMVTSSEEARQLRKILDSYPNQTFAVHHQMRHAPAFEAAIDLVRSGKLGRVFYVEANYWHDMHERSTRYDDWRTREGQSLIFGHSCHPIDVILNLIGKEPTSHSTFLSKIGFDEYPAQYTSATTIMQFENGTIAKTHVNSCCVFPQYNNLIILGDKASYIDGMLFSSGKFEQFAGFYKPGENEIELNVINVKLPKKLLSKGFKLYLDTMNWLTKRLMNHPDYGFRHYPMTVYNHDAACQTMIDNFVDAAVNGKPVLVGFDDAARVIRICEETERDGLSRLNLSKKW